MIGLDDVRREALRLMADAPEGEPLSAESAVLIDLAVTASVTSLDPVAIGAALDRALDAGASADQIQEILALVSGMGVHTLMMTTASLADRLRTRGALDDTVPFDARRQELWDRHVGSDPYWIAFEEQVPGFLRALLRLSPPLFEGFFAYCALPWTMGRQVRALTKELAALACDATPTHRFLPGFRLHLLNALKLGAGRRAVLDTLAIAAASPAHSGVG